MSEVRLERDGDVAIIVVDNPPVNVISQAVRAGLVAAVEQVEADSEVRAAVLRCAGRTFMAGADIREFGKPALDPILPAVVDRIELARKPIIAAIHGQALGGGCEIALGCHGRIAVRPAKIGLPEVNLGIIPGAGGCVRLPRLIGAEAALDMILAGAPIAAERAHALGLLDLCVDDDLRGAAIAFAREIAAKPVVRTRDRAVDADGLAADFWDRQRAAAREKYRGRLAPLRAIDAIEFTAKAEFDQAAREERAMFIALRDSAQAAALRHAFFAEREVGRIPGLRSDAPVREIRSAAVIGAGAMGAGIATTFADIGVPVRLLDISQETVDRGLAAVRKIYDSAFKRGRISEDEREARQRLIVGGVDYEALRDVDLVVEAVFESMTVKREVLSRLDAACRPGAILATNTSYLDINEIARATRRPGDVIGLHYFNPPHVMKLLEIVRARETSEEVLASCAALARRMGKIGVVSGVGFGFIGNRMLNAYRSEALRMALEGAPIASIDRALCDFGMAMGPFALMDLTGLDINVKMRKEADPALIDARAFGIVDRLADQGRLGQKAGAGFYRYETDARQPREDPQLGGWLVEEAAKGGIARRDNISADEIVERSLLMLANEGAKILDEGVAMRALDIDVVYVNGYGFPRHEGGPMYWAQRQGLARVLARLRHYADIHGARWWTPALLLVDAVAAGRDGLEAGGARSK